MAFVTQNRIGFVSLMTLRALNLAALCYMVFVRIWQIILRSLRDSLQRFMAGKTDFFRCSRFRLLHFVTSDTGYSPAFVAIRGKAIGLLFADNSAYTKASNQDQTTNYFLNHLLCSFSIILDSKYLYTKSFPAKCRPTIRPKVTQRPWLKP
jgi:hypothetical protein